MKDAKASADAETAARAGGRTWEADGNMLVLDGTTLAWIAEDGQDVDADELTAFIASACNAAEQRANMEGPWGDCGPFCPYCGNLRGQHRPKCQVVSGEQRDAIKNDGAANARTTLKALRETGYMVEGADLSWGRMARDPDAPSEAGKAVLRDLEDDARSFDFVDLGEPYAPTA